MVRNESHKRKARQNYILGRVAETEGIEAKRTEALILLNTFQNGTFGVPSGGHNPACYWQDEAGAYDLGRTTESEARDIRKSLKVEEYVFRELKELFGEEVPEQLQEYYRTFRRNKGQTNKLLNVPRDERGALPTHEFFPWATDFNGTVHRDAKYGWSQPGFSLEEIKFAPVHIGSGGFGDVYVGENTQGEQYALKIFHPSFKVNPEGQRTFRGMLEGRIAMNLFKSRELFTQKPFIPLKGVYRAKEFGTGMMSVMDYLRGKNLEEFLREEERTKRQEGLARALLTYATMLELIHGEGLIFVDNSPGAVIIGEEDTRICDYDFVAPPKEALRTGTPGFFSYEYLAGKPLTPRGDLEGLALIADMAFNGNKMLGTTTKRQKDKAQAEENKREYPKERYDKLPENLQEIVKPLLTYPHTEQANSLTATDFKEAIKQDLKV